MPVGYKTCCSKKAKLAEGIKLMKLLLIGSQKRDQLLFWDCFFENKACSWVSARQATVNLSTIYTRTDSLKKKPNFRPGLSGTKASASEFQEEEPVGFATVSEDRRTSNNVPAVADPVVTQPGLGITTTTVTTITQTGGDWSTGLFDICGDKTTCNMNAHL